MITYHVKVVIEISESRGSEPRAGRTLWRSVEARDHHDALALVEQATESLLSPAAEENARA